MRPRKMDRELFDKVCAELEQTHEGLDTICKRQNSSASAFNDLKRDDEELTARYVRARQDQAHYLFDLMREVVFNRAEDHTPFTGMNVVNRDRLIADTLKFASSKLLPKVYGDKIDVTTEGKAITTTTVINLGSGVKPDDETTSKTGER